MEPKPTSMGFGRRLLLCEVAAVLMAGGLLGQVLSADNRFNLFFSPLDTWVLLGLVGGAGLAAAILLQGLAWISRGRSDAGLVPWFFFYSILVVFNFFPNLRLTLVKHASWLTGPVYYLLIWLLGGLLTAAAYRFDRLRRAASRGWNFLLVGWPLLLYIPFRFWTASFWNVPLGSPADLGTSEQGEGPPVVVVILDMIGYADAFEENGRVREILPRMAAVAETATVYHRARSCGDWTETSLPGLMLQEEVDRPLLDSKDIRWHTAGSPEGPARRAAEFEGALPYRFREAGGRAFYIGYYLPYEIMMPEAWDETFAMCFYGAEPASPGSPWRAALWHQIMQYVAASKDPLSAATKHFDWLGPLRDRYSRKIALEVMEEARRFIRLGLSPGDLVIIHLPVPHMPFVFDAQGGPGRFRRLDPAGFPDQLIYADALLGELADLLKAAGKWDPSWVVVLSDHGSHLEDFSDDPARKRHVPFLVKRPGQRQREDSFQPLRLADLDAIPGFPIGAETGGGD